MFGTAFDFTLDAGSFDGGFQLFNKRTNKTFPVGTAFIY